MARTVRITVKGDYNLEKLIEETNKIDGKRITVAPQGDRNEFLASIHEYGIQIRVTDRMRGFLASQGLYLKKSTTFINIPERSFMRSGWDQNEDKVLDMLEMYIKELVSLDIDASKLLSNTGEDTSLFIREYAKDLDNPSNHPFTIERKGFNDPLIQSGSMVNSIDYTLE